MKINIAANSPNTDITTPMFGRKTARTSDELNHTMAIVYLLFLSPSAMSPGVKRHASTHRLSTPTLK